MDWTVHYAAIYDALGVDATITLAETDEIKSVRVIDKTAGMEIADNQQRRDDVLMSTIHPVCAVRATELVAQGIALSGLKGSTIVFNGTTWRVENRRAKPSPNGELDGEIYLILTEERNV